MNGIKGSQGEMRVAELVLNFIEGLYESTIPTGVDLLSFVFRQTHTIQRMIYGVQIGDRFRSEDTTSVFTTELFHKEFVLYR